MWIMPMAPSFVVCDLELFRWAGGVRPLAQRRFRGGNPSPGAATIQIAGPAERNAVTVESARILVTAVAAGEQLRI
jgi:hypothetical protein